MATIKSRADLLAEAAVIKNENTNKANTKTRIAEMHENTVASDFNKTTDTSDDLTEGSTQLLLTAGERTAIPLNTTHRSSDGKNHADVVLNNTHRASDGKNHADVVLNNTHRASDGKNHSDVVLNNTHRSSDGSNHSKVTANETAIGLRELLSNKNINNGYAPLDASALIPLANLPDSVKTGSEYKGAWNAATNTPTLIDGTGSNGDYYRISVAGSQDLGSGSITFTVGDLVIYNGTTTIWEKISGNPDLVQSVAGKQGVVTLVMEDIGQATGSHTTPIDADNLTVWDSVAAAFKKLTWANIKATLVKADVGLGNVDNVATDDTAYDETSWNANADSATKNAIRDKVVTMDAATAANTISGGGTTQSPSATLDLTNSVSRITMTGDLAVTSITNAPTGGTVRTFINAGYTLSILGFTGFTNSIDYGAGEYQVRIVNSGTVGTPILRIYDMLGGSITTILMQDPFTAGSLDTSTKWDLTNPNAGVIDVSTPAGKLLMTATGTTPSAQRADYIKSQISTNGECALGIDYDTLSTLSMQIPQSGIWVDDDNRITMLPHAGTGFMVFYVRHSGSTVETHNSGTVALGNRFAVNIDASNRIRFWVDTGSGFVETDGATDKTYDLGANRHGIVFFWNSGTAGTAEIDNVIWNGVELPL